MSMVRYMQMNMHGIVVCVSWGILNKRKSVSVYDKLTKEHMYGVMGANLKQNCGRLY